MLISKKRIEKNKNSQIQKNINGPAVLLILDGWGLAPSWGGNAITLTNTPVFDGMWKKYPNAALSASGLAVGLPDGSPGNSEAGHLNIGAGRLVKQDQTVIDQQIESGDFFKNEVLVSAIKKTVSQNRNFHIMGLLSTTGTHSHVHHLYQTLRLIKDLGGKRAFVHLFSDGRDSDPMSGVELIEQVEEKIKEIGIGRIASVSGRFYAMDRDNRWGRIARVYNALTKCEAEKAVKARDVFTQSYARGITDEFIEPRIVASKTNECVVVNHGDTIISFNFRSDRVKQMTSAFIDDEILQFPDRRKLTDLTFVSYAMYGHNDHVGKVVYPFAPDQVSTPIAKVISERGLKQFHISETEKYAHVTYFINGGEEKPFLGEDRKMISSPKVRTYDLTPKMSAKEVTDELILRINMKKYDFFVVNLVNADMVGHTGNLSAASQAVAFLDVCLGRIVEAVHKQAGTLFVCADHGNAEQMVNPVTGQPDTEHTTNPIPFIVAPAVVNDFILQSSGALSNIAPTILDIMGIEKPQEMNSRDSLKINT